MPPPSLHAEGWRQGSLIRETLSVHFLDLHDGAIVDRSEQFDLWLLATQDCDLDQTPCTNSTRQFELRPVSERTPDDRLDGLRSRTVLVTDQLVLRSDSKRLTLSARALNTLKGKREEALDEERRVQIKTWLGLRYDRPAIPTPLVPLGRRLKSAFIDDLPATFDGVVRDVWVYFENQHDVRIFVILVDIQKRRADEVRDWVSDVSATLSDENIIVRERHVEAPDRTPLSVLQTYYGLGLAGLSNDDDRGAE
jgi:hypothetical protein